MTASVGSKRVLVMAHDPDGPAGQVGVRLRERGFEVDSHTVAPDYTRPQHHEMWPDWAAYDLVLLMGSVRSLTRRDEISEWIYPEFDAVRAAQDRDQPMLGMCFGGQLLAAALGGSVEAAPEFEIGWCEVDDAGTHPIGSGPWFEWHHDRFEAPPGAEVLAANQQATQMFRLGRSVGTQFHPEVDVGQVEGFLSTADDKYLRDYGIDPVALLESVRENEARNIEQCFALVDWFLDEVAFPDAIADAIADAAEDR